MEKSDVLMRMIETGIEQFEQYEHLSTNYSIACIAFVGVLLSIILTSLSKRNEENAVSVNRAIACILLIMPSLATLYIYVFAMNTRKVAIYQGYLRFLEEELNNITGSNYMLQSSKLIDSFMATGFTVNQYGPIVMAIFLAMIAVVSFVASYYFFRASNRRIPGNLWFCTVYHIGFVMLLLVFVIFTMRFCVSELMSNNMAREAVYRFSVEQQGLK